MYQSNFSAKLVTSIEIGPSNVQSRLIFVMSEDFDWEKVGLVWLLVTTPLYNYPSCVCERPLWWTICWGIRMQAVCGSSVNLQLVFVPALFTSTYQPIRYVFTCSRNSGDAYGIIIRVSQSIQMISIPSRVLLLLIGASEDYFIAERSAIPAPNGFWDENHWPKEALRDSP